MGHSTEENFHRNSNEKDVPGSILCTFERSKNLYRTYGSWKGISREKHKPVQSH